MITVGDLLTIFDDFSLLTSCQTDNEVMSVSVMDAPDIHRWMKGGEFLITSGFTLASRIDEFEQLVLDLSARSVAALGIKVSRYMHQVPESIIQLADSLDFCMIEIPEHYAFTDIINPVLAEIVNQRYRQLRISEEMNQKFLQIGVADVSYEKILNLLVRYVGDDVFYWNKQNQTIHAPQNCRAAITLDQLQNGDYTAYDVDYQRIHYGVLYVKNNCPSFQNRAAISHAITMLRLSIQTILSSKRYEEQRRNDFLSDLIFNKIHSRQEIDFRSQEYGWQLHDGVFCVVFQLEANQPLDQADLSARQYDYLQQIRAVQKKHCRDCYYIIFSDHIVFLFVGLSDKNLRDHFLVSLSDIRDQLANPYFRLLIGVGNLQSDITQAHTSYDQAMAAARLGQALFRDQSVFEYDQVAIYQPIAHLSSEKLNDIPLLRQIVQLAHTDQTKDTIFIPTLQALIEADWNMSTASRRQMIHYNTMKYRIARLKQATGWSMDQREEKFQLEMALKIFLLQQKAIGQRQPKNVV